jgi:hypothetical protein
MKKLNKIIMLPQHKRDGALPSIYYLSFSFCIALLIIDKVNIVKGTVKGVKMLKGW